MRIRGLTGCPQSAPPRHLDTTVGAGPGRLYSWELKRAARGRGTHQRGKYGQGRDRLRPWAVLLVGHLARSQGAVIRDTPHCTGFRFTFLRLRDNPHIDESAAQIADARHRRGKPEKLSRRPADLPRAPGVRHPQPGRTRGPEIPVEDARGRTGLGTRPDPARGHVRLPQQRFGSPPVGAPRAPGRHRQPPGAGVEAAPRFGAGSAAQGDDGHRAGPVRIQRPLPDPPRGLRRRERQRGPALLGRERLPRDRGTARRPFLRHQAQPGRAARTRPAGRSGQGPAGAFSRGVRFG